MLTRDSVSDTPPSWNTGASLMPAFFEFDRRKQRRWTHNSSLCYTLDMVRCRGNCSHEVRSRAWTLELRSV